MTRRTAFAVMLSFLLVHSADAQCAHQPPILATVMVVGCVAASFEATDVSFAPGREFAPGLAFMPGSTDIWRMYHPGDKRSGTLLTFSVISSKFVWEGVDHSTNGARLWEKRQSRSVFVEAAPSDTCPRVLPAPLRVQTQPECFDMSHNILPGTIPLATVKSEN